MWDIVKVERRLLQLQFPSVGNDSGFSWRPCYACQRPLGGNRLELCYIGEDGELYTEEVCEDCAIYIANGELPETDQ